ncbi:hypothetical protein CQW23_27739 [Capsicum baccatum]|uniref:DUF2828 domain-containing protein n=1 Tax=Capsicum baccatum TaxID=33114 RepID=A0A2G2VEI2_CAPBA|nr:hypothetical protein CQW23_27739 [Capsicum baccatum]
MKPEFQTCWECACPYQTGWRCVCRTSSAPPEKLRFTPVGFTENGSATFLSTGNPCLDFFFHVVPDTPPQELLQRLQLSWKHNALITLKLICNLRGVRGIGKSQKEGFYSAALWLHKHHPTTLACNIEAIADFGYFKDVLEILYRLLEGDEVRMKEKKKWLKKKGKGLLEGLKEKKDSGIPKRKTNVVQWEKTLDKADKFLDRYTHDYNFHYLYEKVSVFFADALWEDMELYNEGKFHELSLAAKWCPSLDSSYDRNSLRKEVLVPLRKVLEIPEVYICENKWEELPYKHVPSVAMRMYMNLFYKHDKKRFEQYLKDVESGETTIAAGALLPHEIIASLQNSTGPEVAELQWNRMVDDFAKKGKLTNCMAICDVSGSMRGTPMEVCVALGLLISEISEEPWKGKLITFSTDPEFHIVKGKRLSQKTNFIRKMDWDGSTDFQKVFDKILEVAVRGNLREEQMIKRLFVFSDMEFDQASASPWDTDYQVIRRKFKRKGYNRVPEIVFWNLRNSRATPVPSKQQVALVSGFSKNLVTVFLEEGEILSPEAVMMQAISGDEYQKLVVFEL